MSVQDLTAKFKESLVLHSHPATVAPNTTENWAQAVQKAQAGFSYNLAKSMLLKPSKSNSAIYLLAHLNSPIAINQVAKTAGFKEARIAQPQFISDVLNTDKDDVTPFALTHAVTQKETHPIKVYVDDKLFVDNPAFIGFKAFNLDSSVFLKTAALKSFLQGLDLEVTFCDFETEFAVAAKPTTAPAKKPSAKKEPTPAPTTESKQVQIGIEAKKSTDFSNWYTQVVLRTEMLDYYDVSGCYILRPWSYKIWKVIQGWFGSEIEELGVEDCYFPMFVTKKALEREKDHVEGFAPEVAWVTKAGNSELSEHIAVRPTSETVMYPAYSNWIHSHRDLPLRLNQWCNVVRWEFKHPQPFLRTREFLWQEGHTAFATLKEAEQEVLVILDLYRRVYEELLACPVVPGKKSEKEKFAGGLFTTTVEGFIPTTGRAIQGATSHCLGQNFAKMFDITFEDENKERPFVWQNSWGITTRTIGVMIMVHGDDKGLVLPPRVASIQIIVIPVGITNKTTPEQRQTLFDKALAVVSELKRGGLRASADVRLNYTPGYKYNHWEMKGVPLRLEIGPKDLAANSTRVVRRDTGTASSYPLKDISGQMSSLLETVQSDMFNKAKKIRDEKTVRLETWDQGKGFVGHLDDKCLVLAPWCEETKCEDEVKERSSRSEVEGEEVDDKAPSMGAKTLCIPFNQPKENPLRVGKTKCFACGKGAKSYTLWGRSY